MSVLSLVQCGQMEQVLPCDVMSCRGIEAKKTILHDNTAFMLIYHFNNGL